MLSQWQNQRGVGRVRSLYLGLVKRKSLEADSKVRIRNGHPVRVSRDRLLGVGVEKESQEGAVDQGLKSADHAETTIHST